MTVFLNELSILALREGGLIRARGIPYARAARFTSPAPLEKWDGVIDCSKPASICPQPGSELKHVTGDLVRGRPMDEDCLHVSVTVPEHALEKGSAKLPVMVWFHGGAFLYGGGDLDCYSPESIARRGLVVVNVTYRLGIFGYLQIGTDTSPANLGLLDQIEALKWVQRTISRFGGDPDRVTVFGQSAGAQSIYCLMLADHVDGLFQRAILQSAPIGAPVVSEKVYKRIAALAKALLGKNAEFASTAELLAIQKKLLVEARRRGSGGMLYWPRFGSYPLPQESEIPKRISKAAQTYKVLIGWTSHEATAYVPMMTPYLALLFKIPVFGPILKSLVVWIVTRRVFVRPAKALHKQFSESGPTPTYCFRWSPQNGPLKAVHTIELPFLFGSWQSWSKAPMLLGSSDSQLVVEKVGGAMKDLWAAFASGKDFGSKHFDIDGSYTFRPFVD